jgi:membrane protein DedA with SNARE-associated domain
VLFLGDSIAAVAPWLREHGYWAFGVALVLENVLFASMIVPGLFVLIGAGFLAGVGELDLTVLLVIGVSSAWLGDSISYCLGRFFWRRMLMHTRLGASVMRLAPLLQQRGRLFLVLYHFEPAARMVGATLGGASGLSVGRWLPFDFLGAALWVQFYTFLGFALGHFGRSIDDWESLRPIAFFALLVLLLWLWSFNRAARRLLSSARGDAATIPETNLRH